MDYQNDEAAEEDERIRLLDAMATMADRANRSDSFKIHIEEVFKILQPRLQEGSSHAFEIIGQGLFTCGTELPFKAPMYATLAGLLTSSIEPYCKNMAKRLTETVVKQLSASLRDGQASIARRSLRYLACLANANVINPVSVAEYIHALLDAAHFELTSANRSEYGVHCRGEFLADVALSTLPWCDTTFTKQASKEMEKISAVVEQIASTWQPNKWRCIAPSVDKRCTELFARTLEAILELRDANWICEHDIIPRPYNNFELELSSGQELTLSQISIPGHSKVTFYSAPRFRLVLVNARNERKEISSDAELKLGAKSEVKKERPAGATANGTGQEKMDTAASNSILSGDVMDISTPTASAGTVSNAMSTSMGNASEGKNIKESKPLPEPEGAQRQALITFIIRTYVTDIVDNFSTRHLMAAERLLNLPMLKDVNDEIVESLFSQMCAMPSPSNAPVYFGTLFADLCRVKDSRLPAKLLTAVKTMFQNADEFDPEAFDRLADWFSFHLSNFGYKWNWQEWAIYADSDMVDKFPYRALFCKDVIARCVRLSYYDRIKTILPDDMKVFLPNEPNNGDPSRFNKAIHSELMTIVTGKGRLSAPELQERLSQMMPDRLEEDTKDEAGSSANLERLSSLIRAILQAGCRTLSHFDIVVERYMELLRTMSANGGQNARHLITTEVITFWSEVHIRRMYVLDKLAQYGVIDYMAILQSCLRPDIFVGDMSKEQKDKLMMRHLCQSSWWEMIRLVMARVRAREEGSRKELRLASHAAATANEGEQEEAEKRLEKAKASTAEAKREIGDLLLEGLKLLFQVISDLLDVSDLGVDAMDDSGGDGMRLPGFNGKPIWYWRCLGMIRELARMHGPHLPNVMFELDVFTKELREKHSTLWDAFDIIREVEKCSLLSVVW